MMRGIVLAGGTGSRLFPVTLGVNKHLLPVYDKPMIYYPISVLMLAGIRDILIITKPEDIRTFERLLGNGNDIGVKFQFASQAEPRGIADAFLIGSEFIAGQKVALILGDNIFFGGTLARLLDQAAQMTAGAVNFCYQVASPERFGVVRFDESGERPLEIIEKPKIAPSKWAVTGLYFYDEQATEIARKVSASDRGELEITAVNNEYLQRGQLQMAKLGRGMFWLDTGTPDALLDASQFVQTIELRQGLKIASIEEIAWRKGFIDGDHFRSLASKFVGTRYAEHLRTLVGEEL
jgi:glucose-1-phosphate thymidylyltransferase